MTDDTYRILLVDRNPEVISELSLFLSEEGYKVAAASNGEEALLQIYAEVPDFLLLDMTLEDYSGYELCRLLQSYPETSDIAVIFTSRVPAVHQNLSARFHRAFQCLGKPPDRDALKKTLGELQEKRELPARNGQDKAEENFMKLRLEEEIMRARKFNRPLSSLRIKVLWNSPGRDDQQIRELLMEESATVIRKSLRTIDSTGVVESGGFLSLLPHTEKSSAMAYGQKIKNNIAEHDFPQQVDASEIYVAMVIHNYDGRSTVSPDTVREKLEEALKRAMDLKSTRIEII